MSSEFGKLLRISVFGQSHGRAIGVNIDGLPAGESIDLQELDAFGPAEAGKESSLHHPEGIGRAHLSLRA